LMNAMSDIPVTAAWTLALVLTIARSPLAAGLAMSAAIAIRPNLAPLAGVLLLWTLLVEQRERGPRVAASACLRLAAGVAVSVIGIAAFNDALYESPFTSGYGATSDLYGLRFFSINIRQFSAWIADVETPIVAVAALFFVAPGLLPPAKVAFARLLLGGSLLVVLLSYLFYQPFDAWWYLRFLLPMWPVMMLLTAAALITHDHIGLFADGRRAVVIKIYFHALHRNERLAITGVERHGGMFFVIAAKLTHFGVGGLAYERSQESESEHGFHKIFSTKRTASAKAQAANGLDDASLIVTSRK